MYKVATTSIPGGNLRPWNARLSGMGRTYHSSGLGDYQKASFYVPTPTVAYGGVPVTGGLGQSIFGTGPGAQILFYAALAAGGWWLWKRSKRG